MSNSEKFYLYEVKGESPVFVQMINSDGEPGFIVRRFRLFQGRDASGPARRLLRDPSYLEIDPWNKKHGFDKLEFCPMKWIQEDIATFTEDVQIPEPEATIETQYNNWAYAHLAKKERSKLKEKITTVIHRAYEAAQMKQIEDSYNQIERLYLANGFRPKKSTGARPQEVKRQELINLHKATILAWDHASRMAALQERPISEIAEAVYEREKRLLESATTTAGNPDAHWDKITEVMDTPKHLANFFDEFSVKPWSDLREEEQNAFRIYLEKALEET